MKGIKLANEILELVITHGDVDVVIDFREWLPFESVVEVAPQMAPDQMDFPCDHAASQKIRLVPVGYTENKRFSGLCGKGGEKIYEGDRCRWRQMDGQLPEGVIIFDRQRCAWALKWEDNGKTYAQQLEATFSDGETYQNDSIEVLK